MQIPARPDPALLKAVLGPLLDDFQSWLEPSQRLLETHRIQFLAPQEQASLLDRVQQVRQEVSSAQALFRATDGQAGIDFALVQDWHRLVTKCWQVSQRFRQEQQRPVS